MKSEDPFGMRPLWDGLLHVYEEFSKVCQRNNLRYWVGEGNAIGALRHKGFIPWDDDFDVLMLRSDYERFKEICVKELPPHLKFVNWENAPDFQFTFGKIQDTREDVVLQIEKQVGHMLSGGIYIDILVINAYPQNSIARAIYKARLIALICVQRFHTFHFVELKRDGRLLWLLGCILAIMTFSWKKRCAFNRLERLMRAYELEDKSPTWREGASLRTTLMEFPGRIWNAWTDVEFDGGVVRVPAGVDEYLRIQYGNYMKMPSKEKQRPTHSYCRRCPWWLGPTRESGNI